MVDRFIQLSIAVLIASFVGGAAYADCFAVLKMSAPHNDTQFLSVELSKDDPRFELSYRHSVYGTIVRSGYRIEGSVIVQKWETFSQPGYGMGGLGGESEGIKASSENGDQKIFLNRQLPNFVMRIQRKQENRMEHPVEIDLGKVIGNRAVKLHAYIECKN